MRIYWEDSGFWHLHRRQIPQTNRYDCFGRVAIYSETFGTGWLLRPLEETNMKRVVIGTRTCELGILVLVVCYFCSATALQHAQKLEAGVSLISDPKTGTILIPAKLNANPVMMILDTGASHSIFDARAFGISPVQLQAARMNNRGLGLDADVVLRTADVQIADLQWKEQSVEIADLSKLSKIYGRAIDGLVGQDILRTFESVQINYKGDCVMLAR
jgi:hypothetical protein